MPPSLEEKRHTTVFLHASRRSANSLGYGEGAIERWILLGHDQLVLEFEISRIPDENGIIAKARQNVIGNGTKESLKRSERMNAKAHTHAAIRAYSKERYVILIRDGQLALSFECLQLPEKRYFRRGGDTEVTIAVHGDFLHWCRVTFQPGDELFLV